MRSIHPVNYLSCRATTLTSITGKSCQTIRQDVLWEKSYRQYEEQLLDKQTHAIPPWTGDHLNQQQYNFLNSHVPLSVYQSIANSNDNDERAMIYEGMENVLSNMSEDDRAQMSRLSAQQRETMYREQRFKSFAPQSMVDQYSIVDQDRRREMQGRFDTYMDSLSPEETLDYMDQQPLEQEHSLQIIRGPATSASAYAATQDSVPATENRTLDVLEEGDEADLDIDNDEPEPKTFDELTARVTAARSGHLR